VAAGDEIVKVGEAGERMTVAEINALLYLPNHARDRLERALRIEAPSPVWPGVFEGGENFFAHWTELAHCHGLPSGVSLRQLQSLAS
jgi:hypothetical protein